MNCLNTVLLLVLVSLSYVRGSTFNYYAYGSNLLKSRLLMNSPSAKFNAVAVLEGHRLDFNTHSNLWNGAAATIVEDLEANVTGVVWTLDMNDLPNLDKQEEVHLALYFAKNVTVTTLDGVKIEARTYEECVSPPKMKPMDILPYERRPSNTYLEVIIFGAVESGLPSDYIGHLVSFPTNGHFAPEEIRTQLGYPFGPKVHT